MCFLVIVIGCIKTVASISWNISLRIGSKTLKNFQPVICHYLPLSKEREKYFIFSSHPPSPTLFPSLPPFLSLFIKKWIRSSNQKEHFAGNITVIKVRKLKISKVKWFSTCPRVRSGIRPQTLLDSYFDSQYLIKGQVPKI